MNTCGNISERVGNIAVANQFDSRKIPCGGNRNWRRQNPFALVSAPSVEGLTPSGQQIRYTHPPARLRQNIGRAELGHRNFDWGQS